MDSSDILSLDSIRDSLSRQEDTIIFSLIERAKFPYNFHIYSNSFATEDFSGSLLDFVFQKTEAVQATAGIFDNPEYSPFFPYTSKSSVVNIVFPQVFHGKGAFINVNKKIVDYYINRLLPRIVHDGDDGNYALTAASDIACLQALSRRIHYGKYVAEAKFRNSTKDYEAVIREKNTSAIMRMLTSEKQEEMVKRRVETKTKFFGQELNVNDNNVIGTANYKIDPIIVSDLYRDWMIPLTKEVEVDYLLGRLHEI